MLFRWIDQKLVFSTTHLDGTDVVLIHSCVLLRGKRIPADRVFGL
jgi:hypothetical protein